MVCVVSHKFPKHEPASHSYSHVYECQFKCHSIKRMLSQKGEMKLNDSTLGEGDGNRWNNIHLEQPTNTDEMRWELQFRFFEV